MFEFGTDNTTKHFYNFFEYQLGLLEKLYQHQFNNLRHLDKSRIGQLYFLLYSIWDTGKAIIILSRFHQLIESFILARCFLERIINYIYLLFCNETEYLKYLDYTKQKSFRMLNREFLVGNLKVAVQSLGDFNLAQESELKKAVDKFTSQKGKIITRWTNKSLASMLDTIYSDGKIEIGYLMLSILAIYDNASEALHGTIYGTLCHLGTFTGGPPSSRDEVKKVYNEQFSMLFLMLGCCIHTLISAFNKSSEIDSLYRESETSLKSIGGIIKDFDPKGKAK